MLSINATNPKCNDVTNNDDPFEKGLKKQIQTSLANETSKPISIASTIMEEKPSASGVPITTNKLTPSTGLESSLEASKKEKSPQSNLSTDIAKHLFYLMEEVTKDEVTPQTVNSACQCASELYKVMKLNLEISRHKEKK